jgi:hypothetical protein
MSKQPVLNALFVNGGLLIKRFGLSWDNAKETEQRCFRRRSFPDSQVVQCQIWIPGWQLQLIGELGSCLYGQEVKKGGTDLGVSE